MSSLREVQQRCYRAFMLGETASVIDEVRDNEISGAERIGVYQNNAREIFRKALLASYPVVARLVGEECFAGLALKYTRENPSSSGDLQAFGERFPDFLNDTYGATEFTYLRDVARLEWALEAVHLETDGGVLDPTDLEKVPAERYPDLIFEVRRGTRLISSDFPILSIWRANQPGQEKDIDLAHGGERVAVLRHGDDIRMHAIERSTFELVSQLASGATLQDACDALIGTGDDSNEVVTDALRTTITLGVLAGFSYGDSN